MHAALSLFLLFLHGSGGFMDGADTMRRATRFDENAEEAGFIAVFPFALYTNWNDGRARAPPSHRN